MRSITLHGCYGVWCGLMHIHNHIIPLKKISPPRPGRPCQPGTGPSSSPAPNAPRRSGPAPQCHRGNPEERFNNVVIVDRGLCSFGESCVPLIGKYENLLVVKTFSKSRQLAVRGWSAAMRRYEAHRRPQPGQVPISAPTASAGFDSEEAGQGRWKIRDYFDKTRAAIVETGLDKAAAGGAGETLLNAGQPLNSCLLHRQKSDFT